MMTSFGVADLIGSRQPAYRFAAHKAQTSRSGARDRQLAVLMRCAQAGDRAAYAVLLEETAQILKQVVQRRAWFLPLSDREDLVQDILLSLHAARATYDPERPFLPWLMSIAHNRIIDNARRNSRRFSNELLVDEIPDSIAVDGAGASGHEYGDPEALRRAVKNLPSAQRTAIELVKLREMSLKEAARASGMTIGALKVAVHRGIKTLRMALDSCADSSSRPTGRHSRDKREWTEPEASQTCH
jgi:RNA polymerase sigma factor (sigma-70 family)